MTDLYLDAVGVRLDVALVRAMPALSRARVQALILEGAVCHQGQALLVPSFKLKEPLYLQLVLPPLQQATPQAEAIPLEILYEDDAVILINKPKDMVVHPAAGHWSGTLVNALLYHCAGSLSGIGGVLRPGIVHRLDKETTGVMVVAKSDHAHHALSAQFADHGRSGALRRAYKAFVWGDVPLAMTLEAPLARDKYNREKISVQKGGREAITHVTKLAGNGLVSLVECRLETGRTHQIRVHMAHKGFPLLGDPLYGGAHKTKINRLEKEAQEALKALNRQALHAYELGFIHPKTQEFMLFKSALPQDLLDLQSALHLIDPIT